MIEKKITIQDRRFVSVIGNYQKFWKYKRIISQGKIFEEWGGPEKDQVKDDVEW